ncbi:MAG: hypothetical protein JW986_04230 [Methanotrichaceae archaeon]|nr:hypothetical protein [Methanotrichaceae archaeon]
MLREVLIALLCIHLMTAASAQPVMLIGSKSDPNAHLFSYDQKFRESTYLENYNLSMSASKEFVDCTHLYTGMDLWSNPDWVEIGIQANFTGIARLGYVVYDPPTGKLRDETTRISHEFIGNFTLDEHFQVLRNHKNESCYLPPI